jgi:hypothetical protein
MSSPVSALPRGWTTLVPIGLEDGWASAGLDTQVRGRTFVPGGDRTLVVQSSDTILTELMINYVRL